MSFSFDNWTAIEALWTAFAVAGLLVGFYNLRRSRAEQKVAEPRSDESVYALGAVIRDTGRVVAQSMGVGFGLWGGFFNSVEPSVVGSLVFFTYIGSYTIGSVSDAVVRIVVGRHNS